MRFSNVNIKANVPLYQQDSFLCRVILFLAEFFVMLRCSLVDFQEIFRDEMHTKHQNKVQTTFSNARSFKSTYFIPDSLLK